MTLAQELRRKAKEEAEGLWQKARDDAEAHRAEKERARDDERRRNADELAAASAEFERRAIAEAERTARTILASSKAALSERLFRLASQSLESLRNGGQLAALAAELPSRDWQRVEVNPSDESTARDLFPRAGISCDPRIAGGLNVDTEGGRVRIHNTFDSRLEAAWPEILPALMNEVLEDLSHS